MSYKITNKFAVKFPHPMASADNHQRIMTKDIFPPTCYCNYKQQENMNRKIYQRNIPQQVNKLVPNYRPSFRVCDKMVDMNDPLVKQLKDLTDEGNPIEDFTSNFKSNNKAFDNYDRELIEQKYREIKQSDIAKIYNDTQLWNYAYRMWARDQQMMRSIQQDKNAKATKLQYLRDIDVDSELRQGFLHSECPDKRFKPELCETVTVNNPTILDSPYCENYKAYQFNDMTHNLGNCVKSVSKNTKKQYRQYENKDENLLKFNYRNSYVPNSEELPQVDKLTNVKQPVLFQASTDMRRGEFLPVGPQRTDHEIENVWNNITKRKGI